MDPGFPTPNTVEYPRIQGIDSHFLVSSGLCSASVGTFMNHSTDTGAPTPVKPGLSSATFQGLLWSHFFSVAAQCLFFWSAYQLLSHVLPPTDLLLSGWIGWACFAFGGCLAAILGADAAFRYPISMSLFVVRTFELMTAFLAIGALSTHHAGLIYTACGLFGFAAVLAMEIRNAVLPCLVEPSRIMSANAILNCAGAAGFLISVISFERLPFLRPDQWRSSIWPFGLTLIGLSVGAVIGTFSLNVAHHEQEVPNIPWRLVIRLRILINQWKNAKSLVPLSVGIAFGVLFATLALLSLSDFVLETCRFDFAIWEWLLTATVVGWGLGGLIVGIISRRIELGFVPWGALGIVVVALLINLIPAPNLRLPRGPIGHYYFRCCSSVDWGFPLRRINFQ